MKKKYSTEQEHERIRIMSVYEDKYFEQGYKYIAGADECGRGCLAGPVTAAAVILPRGCIIEGINDSKKLSENRRETLYSEITEKALAVAVAMVDSETIDRINILQAALKAMGAAIGDLAIVPEAVLIDGTFKPETLPETAVCETVTGGDGKSVSIAAASIVAKVTRDRLMRRYDKDYPGYGFADNKGYGTKAHYAALAGLGFCPLHRRSFRLTR